MFYIKVVLFKIAKILPEYLGSFCKKICHQKVQKFCPIWSHCQPGRPPPPTPVAIIGTHRERTIHFRANFLSSEKRQVRLFVAQTHTAEISIFIHKLRMNGTGSLHVLFHCATFSRPSRFQGTYRAV